MTNRSYYPPDLSKVLLDRWQEAGLDPAALPDNTGLEMLIDTAYQASRLREENDPVQYRVLVASPDDSQLDAIENADGLYVVQFDELSEFTPHQVRKMAAAVGYYRALIGD